MLNVSKVVRNMSRVLNQLPAKAVSGSSKVLKQRLEIIKARNVVES